MKRNPLGQHWDVRAALGLPPKAKLPVEGIDGQYVTTADGTTVDVWVVPTPPGGNARGKHRARCACPRCGKEMSAGRLGQHVCKRSVTTLPNTEEA